MKIHDVQQRSPEWYALRCGRVTGSCADAILAVRKRGTGELKVRADLRQRLVVERLTGRPVGSGDGYQSAAMEHGLTCEADAFAAYEATGDLAMRVGFVSHDELMAGCSPDGYVGQWEGIVEFKCPSSGVHLDYIKGGVIPEEYCGQLLHALWLTGAQWADFCSFDPRFPAHLQLFCRRMERDPAILEAYELALRLFLSEVDRDVAALQPLEPVDAF